MHGFYALTVDTSVLTDGIQGLLDNVFPWVGIALLILGPIVAIGMGFGFAQKLVGIIRSAIGFGK